MSYWIDENGEIHRGGDGGQTPPPPPPPPNGDFDLEAAVSGISLIAGNIFVLIYFIGLLVGWWYGERGAFLKWASCICIGIYLTGRHFDWIDKDDMPLFFKLFAGIISVIIFLGCPELFEWWNVGGGFSYGIGTLGAILIGDCFGKA